MASRVGGTFVTPILAIAGLVAAGAAGYKLISGCGSCKSAETTLVSVTEDDHGDCALCTGESAECTGHVKAASATEPSSCCAEKDAKVSTVAAAPKTESCCMSKGEAEVKTVAATETKSSCCSEGKSEAEKTACKNGTDGCTGDGKNGCCGGCKEKKEGDGKVATSGK